MRLVSFVTLVAITSCAQIEGLDHFASVDSVSNAVTQPDASPGSSSGNPPPAVSTGDLPPRPLPSDAGAPNDSGGSPDDAGSDSGPVDPPPPADIAPNGIATWSDGFSAIASNQPALNDANDGTDYTFDPDTCLAKGRCDSSLGTLPPPWIQVEFPTPQTVAHVTILGSRNPALSGAHVLTGQLQLMDAASNPIVTKDLTMADPYGDADVVLGAPVGNVMWVRLVVESAAGVQPSFAEIKVYAQ